MTGKPSDPLMEPCTSTNHDLNRIHVCVFVFHRWVHAVCESLYTEDEVEQASDEGFACTACTPYVPRPVGEWVLFLLGINVFKN